MANIEKLRTIVELIKSNPDKLNMAYWDMALMNAEYDWVESENKYGDMESANFHSTCDTTKCFAGHTVWHFARDRYPENIDGAGKVISNVAQEILELTDGEANQIFSSTDDEVFNEVDEVIKSEMFNRLIRNEPTQL